MDALFDIDALAAPRGEGETLIRPALRDMAALAEANRRRRAERAPRLLGRPAAEYRPDRTETGLVFMTGHQPSFFHPGVWAKQVIAAALAERTGGAARMLLVDSDVPHLLTITWPDTSGPFCKARTATIPGLPAGQSYEHLLDPGPGGWERLFTGVGEPWRSRSDSLLKTFAAGFLQTGAAAGSAPRGYVERWIDGMASVEKRLGEAGPAYLRVSDLVTPDGPSADPAAIAFTAHLLLHAAPFAAEYNRALAGYRRPRGIRGRRHPIPDLVEEGGRIETPFWLVHPNRPRRRAFVSAVSPADLTLWAEEEPVGRLDRSRLREDPAGVLAGVLGSWGIRPRALAQTMYARLCACDLFIHGIGGAKYDRITDAIIRGFFDLEPPAYGCVSATLRLPLPRFGVGESDLRAARHQARDLRYNPQRYLSRNLAPPDSAQQRAAPHHDLQHHHAPEDSLQRRIPLEHHVAGTPASFDRTAPAAFDRTARTAPNLSDLLEERARAIEESRRLRKERRADRPARRAAFERIHRANAALLDAAPDLAENAGRRLAELTARLAHDRVATSREWFVALFPPDTLQGLRRDLRADL